MDNMRPGALVGAGIMTILDDNKILTPNLGPDTPRYLTPSELKEATNVVSDHKRILEIIVNVIQDEKIEKMFTGRRKGKAYFSDRSSGSVLGGGDIKTILSDPDATEPDFSEETTFDKEKVNAFLCGKTLPVFVTVGTLESRQKIASTLNSLVDLGLDSEKKECSLTAFKVMFPSQEAFFIAQKVFDCNTIKTGFHMGGAEEVTAFLVLAVGKTTIHWIVYDDYVHYVPMAKSKSVLPGAYKYIYMNYDVSSEDDRIAIALNTYKAIEAWKEMRKR